MSHTLDGGEYLSLQSIDDIKRCNSLSFGMFSVSDSVANDTLKEDFENTTSLLLDDNTMRGNTSS